MTKTLAIYVLISFHVLMEENALNLVMLGDMHMQLSHCYCVTLLLSKNMKLALLTFDILMRKKIDPLNPNISIHLRTAFHS